ncbi:hypothetical protein [Sphingomonas sp. URHD0057]|uniref:hypothetical protein n=1 Tax=Sphingomonas sp. URHD0057 TaxID=1380389 RepID=UPI0012DE76F6|nr:hypothetical protein [Sphingomonas sp. URHD0057]
MTRVRHALSVLVAVAALLSTLGWSNQAIASCPMDSPAMAMSGHLMHQHGSRAPAKADVGPNCAACLAVLPAPAPVGGEAPPSFEPFTSELSPLSSVDPALDPPPPRLG